MAKKRSPKTRKKYIDENGTGKWKPIKDWLTTECGKKCWYTELELIGAPLAIDHYRPACDYWWLAFDAENYRVACPWANSPEYNAAHGCAGGKGDRFPLIPPSVRATTKLDLANELPIILDPCSAADCGLLAFQADGRPIIEPAFTNDPVSVRRVEDSKILLNLDHPDLNDKAGSTTQEIAQGVATYEKIAGGRGSTKHISAIDSRQSCYPKPRSARQHVSIYNSIDI